MTSGLYESARRAHSGTSFDPEKRAESEIKSLNNSLKQIRENLEKMAKTPEQKQMLDEEWGSFEANYISKQRGVWEARSRIMSPMITGPARFPVERNRKRMETEIRRIEEMNQWEEKRKNESNSRSENGNNW